MASEQFKVYLANLGHKVKELREAKGWDEVKLADKAGVPEPLIGRIEGGTLSPGDKLRRMIGDALGFDLNAYADELASSLEL